MFYCFCSLDDGSTNQLVTNFRTFIRYQLGAQLGRGGYGKVYVASQMPEKTQVVVKRIPSRLVKEYEEDGFTPREVAFMKMMGTGVTVEVLDYFQFQCHNYIVMENSENKIDLYKYIDANPMMPEATAQRVFNKLFKIVSTVNRMGILHGDLKGCSTKTKRGGGGLKKIGHPCIFFSFLPIPGFDVFPPEKSHGNGFCWSHCGQGKNPSSPH